MLRPSVYFPQIFTRAQTPVTAGVSHALRDCRVHRPPRFARSTRTNEIAKRLMQIGLAPRKIFCGRVTAIPAVAKAGGNPSLASIPRFRLLRRLPVRARIGPAGKTGKFGKAAKIGASMKIWLAAASIVAAGALIALGQNTGIPQDLSQPAGEAWQCPMDHDVRANKPGVCSRCGMKLVAGIPAPVEFPVDFAVLPRPLRPGQPAQLRFAIRDPENSRPVSHFEVVHEKLFHLFVISQDLEFFVHDHPEFQPDGTFRYQTQFPRSGLFRVLTDFYPEGATPQLVAKTVIVPGAPQHTPVLARDYSTKAAENLHVSLTTQPAQPIAGTKTMLFFHLEPADGLEKLLGAWGHMLAGSDDLIDMIHTHPFLADGGPEMQFNVYFPRPRTYRVWVQFQRQGVVNTASFDVPVKDLE